MAKSDPSTRQLIAEGEALRGGKKPEKAPRTRRLVRDAERLIGREPAGRSRAWLYAALAVLLLGGTAAVIGLLLR